MTPEELARASINEWRDAFKKANGKEAPPVSYQRGWVLIHGTGDSSGSRRRVKDLQRMTDVLKHRASLEHAEKS